MSGALVLRDGQVWWDDRQQAALAQMGVGRAPLGDQAVFLHVCQRTGLDPFAKQIYMIERGGKWGIQTGINGLRVIAQRTGQYRGRVGPVWCGPDGQWTDVWLSPEPPAAARVGVMREGWAAPLWQVAMWTEYGSQQAQWKTMPAHMLGKVAESLALRAAFPQDMAGLVGEDEMHNANAQQPTQPAAGAVHQQDTPVNPAAQVPGVVMSGRAEWDAVIEACDRLGSVDGITRSNPQKQILVAQVLGLDAPMPLKDLTAEQAKTAALRIDDLANGPTDPPTEEPVDAEVVG